MQDLEKSLRAAPPHALVDVVRERLVAGLGATDVVLVLADYSLTMLQPVDAVSPSARSLPLHDSSEGRAFGSQEPRTEAGPGGEIAHHLPVTVRGERLGVLTVRLPGDRSTAETVVELAHIAALLGHEILVAERDTDFYQRARRVTRLTLAAEMQWQLLPGRSYAQPEFEIGAQLEPAYAIHGDNFDWSSDASTLTLAVTNGMSEGTEASLLTSLTVNALRNARRAGIGIADQAALADQAVYAQHRGALYVSTLLMRFDLRTGLACAVDAGSPQLWRRRGRSVERVPLDAQLPLGMFEESDYRAQEIDVRPGDRLLVASDGVYEAASPQGEAYGVRALARAIQSTSLLPAASVPGAVLRELAAHRGSETSDDALVICLDWHGPQEKTAS
ncbi:PP2C family protein-serine/threonine phosphatase [Streptomyces sp. SP18CS02]|uniref:PP2C family protein-serine/threonine phosphatase n=1 Tax=Streptomyces sp. SP18CS02 TaxID=3002531 RepID=UPI002E77896F|nr:PP2C family protein-serine/threonine phosphatase [Streptomyces sp. SP18CS02]MEE1757033.1 PP2C family protein-serine/threonine phosphatase [Streptomyces sp. SP18CS02]